MRLFKLALLAGALAAPTVALASPFSFNPFSVGPHYRPRDPKPAVLLNADPKAVDLAAEPGAAWWKVFEDPVLDELVGRAVAGNLDLKQAEARLRQARAIFKDARLDFLPRVASDATYNRSDQQIPGFGSSRQLVESADIGFDAAWEIDLFGRVRHGVEAARSDAGAADADLAAAKVSVMAEVARTYFGLRGAQARLAVAQENEASQRETVRLTQVRFEVGRGDPVDVKSAQARLSATEATIPDLQAQEAAARYRLAVLLGLRPGALDEALAARAAPPPALVKPLPIGDAAQFLRRRPDVQAAEWRLRAETARTGVATADLFPRIRVTGFIGLLSGDVSKLFAHGSQAWSVSPQVTWPALDLGGAHARLKAQEARQDEILAAYDQTVLIAVQDLETALNAYRQQQRRIVSLAEQVEASRGAADLARVRFKEGSIDFLVLLDAERTLLGAEDALTAAQTDANTDVVAIYKALGGGWG
ncbi:MAG: efflux transporter outer membrane subunit [Caulobacteraceae bacterium]